MTDWPPEQRAKLSKLIRLLSSPQASEVLAAARALQRTLASAQLTLHDLADVLLGPEVDGQPSGQKRAHQARTARTAGDRSEARTLDDDINGVWLESCQMCLRHSDQLTAVDLAFVQRFEEGLTSNRAYKNPELKRLMMICERIERHSK